MFESVAMMNVFFLVWSRSSASFNHKSSEREKGSFLNMEREGLSPKAGLDDRQSKPKKQQMSH